MSADDPHSNEPYTTIEVASLLGLAVRSVQLMVDRGDLQAWIEIGAPSADRLHRARKGCLLPVKMKPAFIL